MNQQAISDAKVKQMEKENTDFRQERDIIKIDYNSEVEQLRQQREAIFSELNEEIADYKLKVLQLEKEKDDVIQEKNVLQSKKNCPN